jgi:macrolide-specific efflux system membrane fusion protein
MGAKGVAGGSTRRDCAGRFPNVVGVRSPGRDVVSGFFRRHRRGLAVLAVLVILGAGYVELRAFLRARNIKPISYVTQPVVRGTLITSVSGTGNTALADNVQVVPQVSGTVSGLTVKVGVKVTKGQLLFTLVNDQLDLDVANAQASYDQAVAGVQTAQLNVLKAQQSYQQLQQQYYAQFTTTTATPTARPSTTNPPTTHPPTTKPPTSSSTTTTDRPTTTTTGTPSTLPATTTTATLASWQTGTSVQLAAFVVAAAPSGSASGASGSTTGSTITSLDLQVAQQQITTAQLAVTTAQNSVTQASTTLAQAKQAAAERDVTAPADGSVTVLNVSNGDVVTGSGSTAKSSGTGGAGAGSGGTGSGGTGSGGTGRGGTGSGTGSTGSSSSSSAALEISNPGLMNAVVQLNEVDVTQLKGGEKATMTFDAVSGLTLAGSVTSIDTVGTVTQGVVTYNVYVSFDATGTAVRPGMTVTAAIVTSVTQNALYVPNAAVKTSGNGQYVQVVPGVGQAPVQKTVTVGVATDTYTQILTGVNEGDNVVTQTINPNTTVTTVSGGSGLGGILGGGGATRGVGGGGGGAGFRPPGG